MELENYKKSQIQEKISEYNFLHEFYKYKWHNSQKNIGIMKPFIDEGIDFVIISNGIPIFIQLKSTFKKSSNATFSISMDLLRKEKWCLIVTELGLDSEKDKTYTYRFVNNDNILDYSELKISINPANKRERPNYRDIKAKADSRKTISEIFEKIIK